MFKKLYLCATLLFTITAVQAEESLLMQVCPMTQNTAQTTKLVILDNNKAGEATTVTVTIVRDAAVTADEKWDKVLEYTEIVYGAPIAQDDTTVKFIFQRCDISADTWFNLLSNVEAIFVAVRSTVEGYARVTIELN